MAVVAPPLPPAPSIALLTMSFRGDLELCRLLCETVDRFAPEEFPHILAVPRGDVPLFAPFANARRRLVTQEEMLPSWLRRIPMPPQPLRGLLRLPRRNIYLAGGRRLVRGWIAQQLMKLAATSRSGADVILHVDSDAAFVRPLTREHLVRGSRARLLRTAGAGDTAMHHPWHVAASRLLGLPERRYHGADYIGNLTIWRRALVDLMLARIRDATGGDPMRALAATPDFSEYVLYGAFVDHVVGLDGSGHFETDRLLCPTIWPEGDAASQRARLASLTIDDDQVAVGVQSTVPLPMEERRRIVAALTHAG